jgi:hypothetical protein
VREGSCDELRKSMIVVAKAGPCNKAVSNRWYHVKTYAYHIVDSF